MKILSLSFVLTLLSLSCPSTFAAKPGSIYEVQYQDRAPTQKFKVVYQKDFAELQWSIKENQQKFKVISLEQAEAMERELRHVVGTLLLRQPASAQAESCQIYATITLKNKKQKVCRESLDEAIATANVLARLKSWTK